MPVSRDEAALAIYAALIGKQENQSNDIAREIAELAYEAADVFLAVQAERTAPQSPAIAKVDPFHI